MKKMKHEKLKNCGMQFITHYTERYSYLDAARMALEGGCRWVQLRMKDTSVETIEPVAFAVQALCRQYAATFIIDDHVELAKKLCRSTSGCSSSAQPPLYFGRASCGELLRE